MAFPASNSRALAGGFASVTRSARAQAPADAEPRRTGSPTTRPTRTVPDRPAVDQVVPAGGQQVLGGTSSLDLQAFSNTGTAADPTWPKLTGDWTVATPTLGSFGTRDISPGGPSAPDPATGGLARWDRVVRVVPR